MKKDNLEELMKYPEKDFLLIEYDSDGKPKKIQYKECELNKINNFFVKTKEYGFYFKENNILFNIKPYYYNNEEIYKILETIIKKFNDYPEKE